MILSNDPRIRRFTLTAKSLLKLIDADIGRTIGNIRPNVNRNSSSIAPTEKEV